MIDAKKTGDDAKFRDALAGLVELAEKLASDYPNAAELAEKLEDLGALLKKLAPTVASVADLVAVLNLAGENDGQLRMLKAMLK